MHIGKGSDLSTDERSLRWLALIPWQDKQSTGGGRGLLSLVARGMISAVKMLEAGLAAMEMG